MIRLLIMAVMLAFVMVPGVQAQDLAASSAPQKKTIVEQELIKLETDWLEANKQQDKTSLHRILADDFTFLSSMSRGELTRKTDYIEKRLSIRVESSSFDRIMVRIYGNTAIVNARLTEKLEGAGLNYINLTDVWVKKEGRWQAVARHTSLYAKP